MRLSHFILPALLTASLFAHAQDLDSVPPLIKGYKGNSGTIIKFHYFNFITLQDASGENDRQATGHYWEMNYIYDSVFRQKELFGSFMEDQVKDLGGVLFYTDTSQIHFAIPRESLPNLWGKVFLKSDRAYRLLLVEESAFQNTVDLMNPISPKYDDYVEPVDLPEHLSFLPNTVISSCRFSKFNHYRISFTDENKSYRQLLMGPYWDLKMRVANEDGNRDERISTVQILESYFRAAVKANGRIIKSMSRELIFYIPEKEDKKLWVRVTAASDGVYYIRAILQSNKDETAPVSTI